MADIVIEQTAVQVQTASASRRGIGFGPAPSGDLSPEIGTRGLRNLDDPLRAALQLSVQATFEGGSFEVVLAGAYTLPRPLAELSVEEIRSVSEQMAVTLTPFLRAEVMTLTERVFGATVRPPLQMLHPEAYDDITAQLMVPLPE